MKKLDVEALLLPENYEEFEGKEFFNDYKFDNSGKKWPAYRLEDIKPALQVKKYTKEEILVLEEKMKKSGKL